MGDMVSMIAHQWRQPLNVLALNLQDLELSIGENSFDIDEMREIIQDSVDNVQYMSKVIDDFRNFFQPDTTKSKFFVENTIHSAINILRESLENFKVEVIVTVDDNFELTGYEHEYQQVLLNILRNSQDAFIKEPKLKQVIQISAKKRENISVVEITDNGGGISEDIIENIFEPYFTTKHQSKGTGLGLYMSKIIVEQHMGGKLIVKSSDENTTVSIEI